MQVVSNIATHAHTTFVSTKAFIVGEIRFSAYAYVVHKVVL